MSSIDRILEPKPDLEPAIKNGPAGDAFEPSRAGLQRLARWSACISIVIFCLYRMVGFIPQPLDSAQTLRPILYRWFLAFLNLHVHPEQAFQHWSSLCFVALLIPPALAVVNYARPQAATRLPSWMALALYSRWALFSSIAVCLFLCRYPILLADELNPDEGQFVASAHKLFYDPNFFRSVDCGTSGPLNIYPLMLPAIFGLSPDFASSRVLAIVLVLLSIYLLYRTIALIGPDRLARLAILPAVAAFALFKHADLVQYSSEHVPLFLLSLALYCAVCVLRSPGRYHVPVFVLGLLVCATFFAKMQATPMSMALAVIALAYVHASGNAGKPWLPASIFLAGTLPLAILNAIVCIVTGVWRDFWMSYVVTNLRYADFGGSFVSEMPGFLSYLMGTIEVRMFLFTALALAAAFIYERRRSHATGRQSGLLQLAGISAAAIATLLLFQKSDTASQFAYVVLLALFVVPANFLLSYKKGLLGIDPLRWFGLLSAAFIASALFSIYKAHRTFPHYLLFLFTPVCTAIAWTLLRRDRAPTALDKTQLAGEHTDAPSNSRKFAFVSLLVVLTLTYQTYLWGTQDDQVLRTIAYTIRAPEGRLIRSMTGPHAGIVVWGWNVRPYLGSGRVPATRDTNMANFFRWPEISAYYRDRFVRDMRQSKAEVFVDVAGPGSWSMKDRRLYRFEQFPEIASMIGQSYVHVGDGYEQRYFLRRDLVDKQMQLVGDADRCAATALRCLDGPGSEPRSLEPVRLPPDAILQITFTPTMSQAENGTVFSNEAVPDNYRGFRFLHTHDDNYQLAVGFGSDWALSKEIPFPQGKPVSLSIEFNGLVVSIRSNGHLSDQMHLPAPIADAPGPVTLGSWIGGQRRFNGTISFFQILDAEKEDKMPRFGLATAS